jgi:ankyrin repeat protein
VCSSDLAANNDGWTPLHEAAFFGDCDVIKLLLAAHADINHQTSKDGHTPLNRAVAGGKIEVVRLLLDSGADVHAINKGKWTALHEAALHGHRDIAQLLLEHKSEMEAREKYGKTPLNRAATHDKGEVVTLLLQSHADSEAADNDGCTPLHCAAANNHHEVVTILMDAHANTEATSKDGWTPLHLAYFNKHEKVIKILIKDYPLLTALFHGDIDTLQRLVTVDTPPALLRSALAYAIVQGNSDAVRLLIPRLLETSDASCLQEQRARVQKLIDNPVMAPRRDHFQTILTIVQDALNSLLVEAVRDNNHAETKAALVSGAQIPPVQAGASTLLHTASINGNTDIIELLLGAGANPNDLAHGNTSAHRALLQGHQDAVKLLLNKGTDVIRASNDGRTLLHIAANKGLLEIVKLLLDRGAHINIRYQNRTPLDIAAQLGHHAVVKALLASGATFNPHDPHVSSSLITLFPDPLLRAAVTGDLAQVLHSFTMTSPIKDIIQFALAQGHVDIIKALIPSLAVHASSDRKFETFTRLAETATLFSFNPDPTIPAQQRAAYQTIARDLQAALTHLHEHDDAIPAPLPHEPYNECAKQCIAKALAYLQSTDCPENYSYLHTILTTEGHPPALINNILRIMQDLLANRQISDQDRIHYTAIARILQPPPRPFDEIMHEAIVRIECMVKNTPNSLEVANYNKLLACFTLDLKRTNNPNVVIRPALTLIRQQLAVQSLQYADRMFYQELENLLHLPVTDSLLRTLPHEILNRILAFTLPPA